jgi:hypothetical protein
VASIIRLGGIGSGILGIVSPVIAFAVPEKPAATKDKGDEDYSTTNGASNSSPGWRIVPIRLV